MSYTIVYRKQFIRVGKYVLPMILMGDSHTYTVRRTIQGRTAYRRERFWTTLTTTNGQLLLTDNKLISIVDQWGDDDDKHFFYQGKLLNRKQLQNFVRLGCRRAMSLSEMSEEDMYHRRAHLRVLVLDNRDEQSYMHPVKELYLSDDNIEQEVRALEELLKNNSSYRCHFDFDSECPVIKHKKKVVHNKYWVVYFPTRASYLARIAQQMVHFSTSPAWARKFYTEKGIDNYLKKNGERLKFSGVLPEKVEITS